jgi:hypothetical protein
VNTGSSLIETLCFSIPLRERQKGKLDGLAFLVNRPLFRRPWVWTTALDQLSQRLKPYFVRPESHQRALAYPQGLMNDASRKNTWQVAEEMGEATPYAMQHLLDRAKWVCGGVRDELRAYVQETLASPHEVLVGVALRKLSPGAE